jgi:hypothetical protein
VSPVKYELGFYIPEDAILHNHRRENLKSYTKEVRWSIRPCRATDNVLPSSLLAPVPRQRAPILARRRYERTAIGAQECAYAKLCTDNAIHLDAELISVAHIMNWKQLYLTRGMLSLFSVAHLTTVPQWSNGQSSWLLTQRSRVRFPALQHFLSSSGSGTGSTQPREDKWGAAWKKSSGSGLENWD